MQLIKSIKETRAIIQEAKNSNKTVGFVPTMGALHEGHLSLIQKSIVENDFTVVSIYVNPTQFNNSNDFTSYPRNLDKDMEMLKSYDINLVFAPCNEEMYPEPDNREFEFGYLENTMEGKHRPGHFNGVAKIVSKLFDIIEPDKAYFGEKDFQQLAIIKALAVQLQLPARIIPCPIIREPDGLAMSSRNVLLNKNERKQAANIPSILFEAVKRCGKYTVENLKSWVISEINKNPLLETEYFDIVNNDNLQPVENLEENQVYRGCIAVKVGKTRLIDNVKINC
jgi:pantoate--beta-alanine ligase